jgi:four helix bundle protein
MPQTPNPNKMDATRKSYDLEERTALFGESVIAFCKRIPLTQVTRSLIDQLVRAGTGIGANYLEADDSESKKDFLHKIRLCRKESRETKHWLRMIAAAEPVLKNDARALWQETKELNLIFGAIARGRIDKGLKD